MQMGMGIGANPQSPSLPIFNELFKIRINNTIIFNNK